MFNHVSIGSNDLERARIFYDKVLGVLGYKRTMSEDFGHAYGVEWPEFWIGRSHDDQPATVGNGTHVAFIAASRADVDAFHAAALEAGGGDEGPPGERPYTDNYYAAFVSDLDGNKIEAVHLPAVPFPER